MKLLNITIAIIMFTACNCLAASPSSELSASDMMKNALEVWRGRGAVYSQSTMKVIKNGSEESYSMESWIKDHDKTMIKFLKPGKVRGQAILLNGQSLWAYSPKSKRSVSIPNTMQSSSWMGSDVSYNDISKASKILTDYDYEITNKFTNTEGYMIYVIEATPKEGSAIVWGKEVFEVYSGSYIIKSKTYYDQSGKALKEMITTETIDTEQGKYPSHIVFKNLEKEGEETHIITSNINFSKDINDSFFNVVNMASQ